MAWRTIQRKGDSFWVVIPMGIIKQFNLKKGDMLNFQPHKDQNYIHVGLVPPSEVDAFSQTKRLNKEE